MNEVRFVELEMYPGYRVGDDGSVWSRKDKAGHGRLGTEWREHKQQQHRYMYVGLSQDGKLITRTVHSLVCEAFHGPRPDGYQVCHRNDIKTDNRADNLYWGTPQDNADDAIRNGISGKGEKNPKAKLTEDDVRDIRSRHSAGERRKSLSDEYNVTPGMISKIVALNNWSHIV